MALGLNTTRDASGISYLASDGLGSVSEALSASGTATGAVLYSPYGGVRYSSGTLPTSKGFTGQYSDASSSGLDYYGARYYDPALGQFVSADTVADGVNRYGYVTGNPETFTDPSGHKLCAASCDGSEVGNLSSQQWAEIYYNLATTQQGAALTMALWSPDAWKQAQYYAYYTAHSNALNLIVGQQAIAYRQGRPANDWNASPALMQEYGVLTGITVAYAAAAGGGSVQDLVGDIRTTAFPSLLGPRGVTGTLPGECSFAAETPVATPDGEQAIGSLKAGDQVEAYDPETGKASAQTVEHVWINHDHDLIDLTLRSDFGSKSQAQPNGAPTKQRDAAVASHGMRAPLAVAAAHTTNPGTPSIRDETVHTTSEHPWLTTDRGWVPAGDLHASEQVVRLDGGTAIVASVRVVLGADTMYNLTVSHLHTFLVGIGQYVVHNVCVNFGSNTSKINWDEIRSGHTAGGARASQAGSNKTVFDGLNMRQVKQVVRGAWKAQAIVGPRYTQWDDELGMFVTRQEWEGAYGGWTVRGWYNHTTDTVETAFPYFGP
jgi:RHS repeat-associated protein